MKGIGAVSGVDSVHECTPPRQAWRRARRSAGAYTQDSEPSRSETYLGVYRRQRGLAAQHALHVRDGDRGHVAPRLLRGAADVRQQDRARRAEQPRMDDRLVGVDIEAGGAEVSALEGHRERFFADHVATRRVDENRASLHPRERLTVDDPFGLW